MPAGPGEAAQNRSRRNDEFIDDSSNGAETTSSSSQNCLHEEIEEDKTCPPLSLESLRGARDEGRRARSDVFPFRSPFGASTSLARDAGTRKKKKSNSNLLRRSFLEQDRNYALIFVPEFCHAPDVLCRAVRADVSCVLYDAETPLSDLIKVAHSRLADVNRVHYEESEGDVRSSDEERVSKLDCVGFVCVDDETVSTDVSRAIMGVVKKDLELTQFWTDMGEMLRSGIGRQLHVFVNMCENPDASARIAFTDIEKKQRLSRANVRDCDMEMMVTSQNSGVTAVYHSTAGMYFYEEGLVDWMSSFRSTRTAIAVERASIARRMNSTAWISPSRLRSFITSGTSMFRVGSLLRSVIAYSKSSRRESPGKNDDRDTTNKKEEDSQDDETGKDHLHNNDVDGVLVLKKMTDEVLKDTSRGNPDVGD